MYVESAVFEGKGQVILILNEEEVMREIRWLNHRIEFTVNSPLIREAFIDRRTALNTALINIEHIKNHILQQSA